MQKEHVKFASGPSPLSRRRLQLLLLNSQIFHLGFTPFKKIYILVSHYTFNGLRMRV